MKRGTVSCSWALVLSLAASVHIANAASFDCAKAGSTAEKLICKIKQLSDLDDQLSAQYKTAMSTTSNKEAIKAEQLRWLKERNAQKDETSLRYVYEGRIAVLTMGGEETLRRRAEQGDVKAQVILGEMLSMKNDAEDIKWFRKAAEQGNVDAQVLLGVRYSGAESIKWLRKAAEQGSTEGMVLIAVSYYDGRNGTQDYAEAIKWYRKAADLGDANAKCRLGEIYSEGIGVPRDYAEGMKWYRSAAAQGDGPAQDALGEIYCKGEGVPQDTAAGIKWYSMKAEHGERLHQRLLGDMYYKRYDHNKDTCVPQDYTEAAKWYRKAAEQWDIDAPLHLGEMYANGTGVPKNSAEAAKWYRQAAELGNVEAQLHLGEMYSTGTGVPKDYAESAKWYREAAEQGSAPAQINLGEMYSEGIGVPKDSAKAAEWYSKAGEHGYEFDAADQPTPVPSSEPAPDVPPAPISTPPSAAAAGAPAARTTNTPEPSLKIKGLFIGMDIRTVPAILKQKFPDGQDFEVGDLIAERQSVLVLHGTDGVVCIIACGPDSPAVVAIAFEKVAVDALFNAAGMEASEFAKAFVDGYQIPSMDVSDDRKSWVYLSPEGYKVSITLGKQLIIVKTPNSTERKKSFD